MSVLSSAASEFLTRQIQVQKQIVTFRWLSRALSIHVNVAKNELASFHALSQSTDEPVHATFLLTGDVSPVDATRSYRNGDEMDVDDGQGECVSTTKLILVGEEELQAAKAQFTRQPSVHVYSLSSSAIRDATLLAQMADNVRPEDVSRGNAYNQLIGIVVGPDVEVGCVRKSAPAKIAKASIASLSSKANQLAEEKAIANKPNKSETGIAPHKFKQDEKKKGTLNWTKAKTKANNDKDAAIIKEKTVVKKASKTNLMEREEYKVKGQEERERPRVALEKPKIGSKRPSTVMSLSESEYEAQDDNPAPKTKLRTSSLPSGIASGTQKGLKVEKRILFSSDDDSNNVKEQPKPARQMKKGKGRAVLSEDEGEADRSVRGMVALDDSHVTRHNQALASPAPERSNEDAGMLTDSESIRARPKPKRKAKKAIPIGKNGRPKKRVMKSRKSKNARGYMVTEDYSSYESASDSEQAILSDTETNVKAKQRAKKADDLTSISMPTVEEPTRSKLHGKPRGSTTSIVKGNSSSVRLSKGAKADGEEKSEAKKPGASKSSAAAATAKNSDKNHIMNYFGKK